jgi:hypothetical protein
LKDLISFGLLPRSRRRKEADSPVRSSASFRRRLLAFGAFFDSALVLNLLSALALLLAAGCAYTVGPVNGIVAKDKSVQINPFINQTVEPRLTDAVTSQLRKSLQQDGTYRLATHDDGDIIISGTITNFQRHELTFARSDNLTIRDYRLALWGRVTALDRTSGKVILDAPVAGYTMIRVGADITSTERQALPLLAADLAKNVTSLLVEGSW